MTDLPACTSRQSIISDAAKIEGEEERYLDPRSKTTFLFDHISLVSAVLSCSVDG